MAKWAATMNCFGTYQATSHVSRLNIVLSANSDWSVDGVTVARSIDGALELAKTENAEKIFVIGGGQIYKLFLAYATSLEMTEVHDAPLADTFFPNFSGSDFREVKRERITNTEPKFDYVTYQRV